MENRNKANPHNTFKIKEGIRKQENHPTAGDITTGQTHHTQQPDHFHQLHSHKNSPLSIKNKLAQLYGKEVGTPIFHRSKPTHPHPLEPPATYKRNHATTTPKGRFAQTQKRKK